MSQQARNWCFTINNPIRGWINYIPPMTYLIYQLEKGKEGTTHYQGYVEFSKPMRIAAIKKINDFETAHLEQRKGTQDECINYVSKEDTRITPPVIHGTPSKAGPKTNCLDEAIKDIKEGKTLKQISVDNPLAIVKHHTGLGVLFEMQNQPRRFKSRVWLMYGESGSGKSHLAHELFPDSYVLPKSMGNAFWFDGYEGQNIILDDFYGWLPMAFLLEFLDKYPQRLPIKGRFIQNTAKNIIILSNTAWNDWYKSHCEKIPQHAIALERRIDVIWRFTGMYGKEPCLITIEKEDNKVMPACPKCTPMSIKVCNCRTFIEEYEEEEVWSPPCITRQTADIPITIYDEHNF